MLVTNCKYRTHYTSNTEMTKLSIEFPFHFSYSNSISTSTFWPPSVHFPAKLSGFLSFHCMTGLYTLSFPFFGSVDRVLFYYCKSFSTFWVLKLFCLFFFFFCLPPSRILFYHFFLSFDFVSQLCLLFISLAINFSNFKHL